MKEDAQLICPLGYEDPSNTWSIIDKDLNSKFPIENVSFKSQSNQEDVKITSLPLRCMPMSANLFKDTHHPFRWFLAPYVHFYILVCEGLDAYKITKPKVKAWIESQNTLKRSSWLIVYLPMGSQQMELYQRVYSKLAADFHAEKPGDRTTMLLVNGFRNHLGFSPSSTSTPHLQPNSLPSSIYSDFILKLRDGVITSFQHRLGLYEAELKRLEGLRYTPASEFNQLLLVRESLALMCQMMQMPKEALHHYDLLQAQMADVLPGELPERAWPLELPDSPIVPTKKSTDKKPVEATVRNSSGIIVTDGSTPSDVSSGKTKVNYWGDSIVLGDSILSYSINIARMKVLKNKIGRLEYQRYLFGRRCYFYGLIGRVDWCPEMGLQFIKLSQIRLKERFIELQAIAETNTGKNGSESPSTSATGTTSEHEWHCMNTTDMSKAGYFWAVTACVAIARHTRKKLLEMKVLSAQGETDDDLQTRCGSSICALLQYATDQMVGIIGHRISREELCEQSLSMANMLNCWKSFEQIQLKFPDVFRKDSLSALDSGVFTNVDKVLDCFGSRLKALFDASTSQTTTEHQLKQMELEIDISLELFLAQEEQALGRPRFGWQRRLRCADRLICTGQFLLAKVLLQNALLFEHAAAPTKSKASVMEDVILHGQNILSADLPLAPTDIEVVHHFTRPVLLLGEWEELRYWITKKMLLCVRALDDAEAYVVCSLQLLSGTACSVTLLERYQLMSDVLCLVGGVTEQQEAILPSAAVSAELPSTCPNILMDSSMTVNMSPILKFHLHLNSAPSVSAPVAGTEDAMQRLNCYESSILVNEEKFTFRGVQCEAGGRPLGLELRIASNFPLPVQIDHYSVLFGPLATVLDATTSISPSSSTSASELLPIPALNMTENIFCFPDLNSHVTCPLMIYPGQITSLPLVFDANVVGEFVPLSMTVRVGSLTFSGLDLRDMGHVLDENLLLKIRPSSDPIVLKAFVPPLTAVMQEDCLVIRLKRWREMDEVSDISISVAGSTTESVPAGSYEQSTIPANATATALAPIVNIGRPSTWEAHHQLELGTRAVVSEGEALCGLSLSTSSGDSLEVLVPFTVHQHSLVGEKSANRDKIYPERCILTCTVSGVLKRGNSSATFTTSVECEVIVSDQLTVECSGCPVSYTAGGQVSDMYQQLLITNKSSVPWRIWSIRFSEEAKQIFSIVDNEDFSDGVEVGSGEVYAAAVGLRSVQQNSIVSPDDSPFSLIIEVSRAMSSSFQNSAMDSSLLAVFNARKVEFVVPFHITNILEDKEPALASWLEATVSVSTSCPTQPSNGLKDVFLVGTPIHCRYTLRLSTLVKEVSGLLSVQKLLVSISESSSWAAVGTLSKVFSLSLQATAVQEQVLETLLVPLDCGILTPPALQLRQYAPPPDTSPVSFSLMVANTDSKILIQPAGILRTYAKSNIEDSSDVRMPD